MAISGGNAYVASLRGEVLWRVPLNGTRAGKPVAVPIGERSRLRTIEVAPDGRLWLMTNNTDGRGDPGPRDDRIMSLRLR
jgi:streptogramin lyase